MIGESSIGVLHSHDKLAEIISCVIDLQKHYLFI